MIKRKNRRIFSFLFVLLALCMLCSEILPARAEEIDNSNVSGLVEEVSPTPTTKDSLNIYGTEGVSGQTESEELANGTGSTEPTVTNPTVTGSDSGDDSGDDQTTDSSTTTGKDTTESTPDSKPIDDNKVSEKNDGEIDKKTEEDSEKNKETEVILPPAVNFTQAGPYLGALTYIKPADINPQAPTRSKRSAPNTRAATNPDSIFENNIGLTKNITPNDDGSYKLHLEAFTAGTVTTTTQKKPLDISLVLDVSGSMAWDFAGNSTDYANSRHAAMKTAVNNFIDKIYDNAKPNLEQGTEAVKHRIGITSFGTYVHPVVNLSIVSTEAERDAIKSQFGINLPYNTNASTRIDLGVDAGITTLNTAPSVPDDPESGRGRVLIVFTDGYPTAERLFQIDVADWAIAAAEGVKDNTTIYTIGIFNGAKPLEMQGGSGYAQNSNGTLNSVWYNTKTRISSSTGYPSISENEWMAVQVPAANRFMNLLSSNAAVGISNLGLVAHQFDRPPVYDSSWWVVDFYSYTREYGYKITAAHKTEKSNYYLSAGTAGDLNNVFEAIASNLATPGIELPTATTELRDTLSDHFVFPEGFDADSITLQTYECTGKTGDQWTFAENANPVDHPSLTGVTTTVDLTTNTIGINNYNYNANYVTEEPKVAGGTDRGRKLVIEFNILPKSTSFGGNAIPTNHPNSGLIDITDPDNPKPYLIFPQPDADVPLKFEMSTTPQSVYLGNQVNIGRGVSFANGDISFQPDGTNNAYVDIFYKIYDDSKPETEKLMAEFKIPAGVGIAEGAFGEWLKLNKRPMIDQNYRVEVTVKPSIDPQEEQTKSLTGSIAVNVWRPKLTATNSEMYLGETLDFVGLYMNNANDPENPPILPTNLAVEEWVPDNQSAPEPLDPAPALDFRKPELANPPDPTNPLAYTHNPYAGKIDTTFNTVLYLIPDSSYGFGANGPIRVYPPASSGSNEDAGYLRRAAPGSDLDFEVKVKTASLKIIKQGAEGVTLPANQSFLFEVTGANNLKKTIAIQGAGNKILTGLPIGNYTVKELDSWSWNFTPNPNSSENITLTKEDPTKNITFINTHKGTSTLHDEAFEINTFVVK